MITLVGSVLTLVILIFKQAKSYFDKQKKENARFVLNQVEFEKIVVQALDEMRSQARADTNRAKSVEDKMDGTA